MRKIPYFLYIPYHTKHMRYHTHKRARARLQNRYILVSQKKIVCKLLVILQDSLFIKSIREGTCNSRWKLTKQFSYPLVSRSSISSELKIRQKYSVRFYNTDFYSVSHSLFPSNRATIYSSLFDLFPILLKTLTFMLKVVHSSPFMCIDTFNVKLCASKHCNSQI